jgi:hypothetical protein
MIFPRVRGTRSRVDFGLSEGGPTALRASRTRAELRRAPGAGSRVRGTRFRVDLGCCPTAAPARGGNFSPQLRDTLTREFWIREGIAHVPHSRDALMGEGKVKKYTGILLLAVNTAKEGG